MPKRLTKELFIDRSKLKHGDKYNYDLVEYINSSTKVRIVCKIHGEFMQSPWSHMNGNGCSACAMNLPYSSEQFSKLASKIHNGKYDYSLVEYYKSIAKVKIICRLHGIFEQRPSEHLKGKGCRLCSNAAGAIRNSTDARQNFEIKANLVHNNVYSYSEVDYVNNHTKVKITCTQHGIFEQTPNRHLVGQGCPDCGKRRNGWNRTKFIEMVNRSGTGILYVIRLYDDIECFYKIGITSKPLKIRLRAFPYNCEIIHLENLTDGGVLFNLENYLLNSFKKFKYKPSKFFKGHSECFLNITQDSVKICIEKFHLEQKGVINEEFRTAR